MIKVEKENIILRKTFRFSLMVITFSELLESKRKYVIAKQILKAGTSIGANVKEAQNAESRKDYIHKMKIAAKEAEEMEYWIELCNHAESYPSNQELLGELKEIQRVLTKIISTSKNTLAN
jgi:four helix bundle protein